MRGRWNIIQSDPKLSALEKNIAWIKYISGRKGFNITEADARWAAENYTRTSLSQ
jgi:hypothetical protein